MSTSAALRVGATPAGYTRDPPGVSSLGVFTFSATRDSAACQACPEHPLFQRASCHRRSLAARSYAPVRSLNKRHEGCNVPGPLRTHG